MNPVTLSLQLLGVTRGFFQTRKCLWISLVTDQSRHGSVSSRICNTHHDDNDRPWSTTIDSGWSFLFHPKGLQISGPQENMNPMNSCNYSNIAKRLIFVHSTLVFTYWFAIRKPRCLPLPRRPWPARCLLNKSPQIITSQ
ncbi:hypothetical protein BKA67DRAFT_357591 [Truncatella angustata]|uniref:Uncharacterized protein n=1 Tax=Truncatella angustata TaxID=152316 RepID=A0A9P8ZSX9_9PEZI|nr:uncharacterized protein BKA67DRAFT_357591 [Truncatella angustata]KAH6648247.1 hypothetical protein BKA67DRAFT_357591 [Truncatella angustata]